MRSESGEPLDPAGRAGTTDPLDAVDPVNGTEPVDLTDHASFGGRAGPADPVTQAMRNGLISHLNRACSDGWLTVEEYSARVHEAHVARDQVELDRLVEDLPGIRDPHPWPYGRRTQWHVSPVGGIRRHGRWQMDRHLVSLTVIGGAGLDLRGAELTAPEVTLTQLSLYGTVRVCVPAGVRVALEGRTLLGSRTVDVDEPAGSDAPLLRIRVFSLFGGVQVETPRHHLPPRDHAGSRRGT